MTARFEVIAAVDAPRGVLVPGEEFGYDQLAEDQHGLVLGDPGATALVLTGRPCDILAYLDAVRAEVAAAAARAAGPPVPSWRSTWPSPRHAAALARQVGAGWLGRSCRLPLVGAWRQLMNNPRQNRYSRRVARRSGRGGMTPRTGSRTWTKDYAAGGAPRADLRSSQA